MFQGQFLAFANGLKDVYVGEKSVKLNGDVVQLRLRDHIAHVSFGERALRGTSDIVVVIKITGEVRTKRNHEFVWILFTSVGIPRDWNLIIDINRTRSECINTSRASPSMHTPCNTASIVAATQSIVPDGIIGNNLNTKIVAMTASRFQRQRRYNNICLNM